MSRNIDPRAFFEIVRFSLFFYFLPHVFSSIEQLLVLATTDFDDADRNARRDPVSELARRANAQESEISWDIADE